MGKIRDGFEKIKDTKGMFHERMGMIKDKIGKYLTEAEEIKKKWQEYAELYKKGLNDPDKHNGLVTHLEPDILECEVKWALGSITTNKASGGDRMPAELLQIPKEDATKVQFGSVAQSCPTLRPHGLQHARLPYPSPTPGSYSNSCPSSR